MSREIIKTPLLSIIIPTFNSENHIQECLDSIKKQIFNDFEVLIIDAESKDKTIEIIEKNQINFPNLLLVSEKDSGIYDAMNKGIERSNSEWLYFLGSDDKLINQNVLECVFEIIKESEPDVLYGNVMLSNSKQIYAGAFDNEKIYEMNISHQAIFFKRCVFNLVGNFDLVYKTNADWVHNFRWFFDTRIKKKYIDKVICIYSENGLSSWYIDRLFKHRKESLYLNIAGSKIERAQKMRVLKFLVINRKKSGNYLEFIWYGFIYFIRSRSFKQ